MFAKGIIGRAVSGFRHADWTSSGVEEEVEEKLELNNAGLAQ
jgi:hypothetical protein